MPSNINNLIDRLSADISSDVGNMHEDNLEGISKQFDSTLRTAMKSFNSASFDDDGFIKRLRDLQLDGKDSDVIKNVLNTVRSDYINVETLNQSELLLRRDIANICTQMPEMRDVIYMIRDAIIEANSATGEVSRSLVFEHGDDKESLESQVKELETRHDILMATKNFIIPNTLQAGEKAVHVVPYAKLFAELEVIKDKSGGNAGLNGSNSIFKESIPNTIINSFQDKVSLYSEENVKLLLESVSSATKIDSTDSIRIEKGDTKTAAMATDNIAKESMTELLKSIDIYNGSSAMMAEMGEDAFKEFVYREYVEDQHKAEQAKSAGRQDKDKIEHFEEYMESFITGTVGGNNIFNKIDQENINTREYDHIKGCYVKYLDMLKTVPIRMDRRVIGYYYITTTMDLQNNAAHPNGMIDLSFQQYTKDRNMVERLSSLIIKSFDKKMLEKNIRLKNEIADIIMAHKFSEGRLSFVFIPENEVVRFVVDEDEEGRGHSVIEPTLFPARSYLMLNMYNMLYTLNNNTTRIHYLKSSGLNKNYAAQIQRTMRKFQSRRITIDDIYSYSGVLNKVGGMGEMVLPAGRGDYRALETDTIEAVNNPISIEFIEQQRRQALSGTGAPNLLIINAIDEVDFAKTVELANARFLSRISGFKIDFNKGMTKLYQLLMKYSTDIDEDIIQSFKFKFNAAKQQELNITSDMIQNFNAQVELTMSIYGGKKQWEDEKGNPTNRQKNLRKELAKVYLPQLDFDMLDEIIKKVDLASTDDDLQDKVSELSIEDEDLEEIDSKKKK